MRVAFLFGLKEFRIIAWAFQSVLRNPTGSPRRSWTFDESARSGSSSVIIKTPLHGTDFSAAIFRGDQSDKTLSP